MTSVCSLADGYTFFVREHPERVGDIQCGYLSAIQPTESGMTYQVFQRLLRINIPGNSTIYIPSPPEVVVEALFSGAEFWIGTLEDDGDAYIANPV